VQWTFGSVEGLAQLGKRAGVGIIAIHIAQQGCQSSKDSLIYRPLLGHAVVRAGNKLLQVPARFRHADDRTVELAAADQRQQRGEDLLIGQVARGAKEDQRVGLSGHRAPPAPRLGVLHGRRIGRAGPTAAYRRSWPRRAS
jgi:hypothetical protein